MKTLIFAVLLFASSVLGLSNEKPVAILSNQAIRHLDAWAEVTGLVVSIGRSHNGFYFLNFGQPYPHQHFTVIVASGEAEDLGGVDWIKDRMIRVTGRIQEKNGRAVMLIINAQQIEDLEAGMRPRGAPYKSAP